jgi:hypothetical protein
MVMNMRKAQITDGIVANIIEVDPANIPDWCADWPDAIQEAEIGGTYTGGVFAPPAPYVPTREQQEAARQAAYSAEADPIAMQMLRDEATKEEWLAKIDEIKARYPYPEE